MQIYYNIYTYIYLYINEKRTEIYCTPIKILLVSINIYSKLQTVPWTHDQIDRKKNTVCIPQMIAGRMARHR